MVLPDTPCPFCEGLDNDTARGLEGGCGLGGVGGSLKLLPSDWGDGVEGLEGRELNRVSARSKLCLAIANSFLALSGATIL